MWVFTFFLSLSLSLSPLLRAFLFWLKISLSLKIPLIESDTSRKRLILFGYHFSPPTTAESIVVIGSRIFDKLVSIQSTTVIICHCHNLPLSQSTTFTIYHFPQRRGDIDARHNVIIRPETGEKEEKSVCDWKWCLWNWKCQIVSWCWFRCDCLWEN